MQNHRCHCHICEVYRCIERSKLLSEHMHGVDCGVRRTYDYDADGVDYTTFVLYHYYIIGYCFTCCELRAVRSFVWSRSRKRSR